MAETSTIFGFMKYVSATDILSDFKKTVDSHFVNSLKYYLCSIFHVESKNEPLEIAVPRGSYLSFNAKNIITENLSQYSKRLIFVVI